MAWSVATSCAIESGEPPMKIYEKLMERSKETDWNLVTLLDD